jgi:hypothetical protein
MPYDCDSYWRPDPVKDAAIWPVPLRRQLPVALAVLAALLILAAVLA